MFVMLTEKRQCDPEKEKPCQLHMENNLQRDDYELDMWKKEKPELCNGSSTAMNIHKYGA